MSMRAGLPGSDFKKEEMPVLGSPCGLPSQMPLLSHVWTRGLWAAPFRHPG